MSYTRRMKTTFLVKHERGLYFRIFGYGLAFNRDMRPSFSERYGHRKILRIGRWAIGFLHRRSLMLMRPE